MIAFWRTRVEYLLSHANKLLIEIFFLSMMDIASAWEQFYSALETDCQVNSDTDTEPPPWSCLSGVILFIGIIALSRYSALIYGRHCESLKSQIPLIRHVL